MKNKEKIIFLDAGTLDYGDSDFSKLEELGAYKGFNNTEPASISAKLKKCKHVIVNKCILDEKIIQEHHKSLKSIHVSATGVNNVDLKAAKKYGVAVTNVAGYSTESVVQFTIGYILTLSNNLLDYQKAIRSGKWQKSPFFVCPAYPVVEVAGKTLVIFGYGTIGKRVAQVAKALRMNVLVCKVPGRRYSDKKLKRVSLEEGLMRADYFSVHAPLSDLTQGVIGTKEIKLMKSSAYLLNLGRGGIINEAAWAKALNAKVIAGGATDVLSQEPPSKGNPLLKAKNLLMTPHVAWASFESRQRLIKEVALNIKAFQNNRARNRVV
jgi:glycerate dehydrogenase